MRKLQIAVALKRKTLALKFKLWKHRVSYAIYQRPDDAVFWFCMTGLFIVQVMLWLGGE